MVHVAEAVILGFWISGMTGVVGGSTDVTDTWVVWAVAMGASKPATAKAKRMTVSDFAGDI
jgi:hypothetical protein